MKKWAYLIDHTTSLPSLAAKIHQEATKLGVHSYDAPVTGGDIGAKNWALITFVWWDAEPFP